MTPSLLACFSYACVTIGEERLHPLKEGAKEVQKKLARHLEKCKNLPTPSFPDPNTSSQH